MNNANNATRKEKKAIGKLKNAVNNIKQAVKSDRRRRPNRAWINVPSTVIPKSKPVRPNTFAARFSSGISDSTLLSSIESMSNTLFSGVGGISRGIAYGDEQTALTRIHNAYTLDVLAGTTASFYWSPAQIGRPAWFVYNLSNADPFAVGTASFGAPFSAPGYPSINPSKDTRVVHARARIVPTSALVNQAGTINAAYYTKLHTGALTSANMFVTSPTLLGLTNQPYYRVYKGTSDASITWVPNRDCLYLNTGNDLTATTRTFSGFYCIIENSGASSLRYRIDIDVGIEYTPTDDYKPFVQMLPPTNIDTCWHYINAMVREHWSTLLLNTESGYQELVQSMAKYNHDLNARYVTKYESADRGLQRLEESKEDQDYCEIVENKLGFDACGAMGKVGRAMSTTATQLLSSALQNNPPLGRAIGF